MWQTLENLPREFPGMDKLLASVVYHLGCRSFNQFCCNVRAMADPKNFCPFCHAERKRRGRKPLYDTGRWIVLENEFPHKNTKQMLLIVPHEHITNVTELSRHDWQEIGVLLQWCSIARNISGGGVMWRFGDPHYNVGTVEHLHINVIEPVCGKEYRAPFAKNMPEHAEDYQRMLGFCDELAAKGGAQWLFSNEGIKQTQP